MVLILSETARRAVPGEADNTHTLAEQAHTRSECKPRSSSHINIATGIRALAKREGLEDERFKQHTRSELSTKYKMSNNP